MIEDVDSGVELDFILWVHIVLALRETVYLEWEFSCLIDRHHNIF